MANDNHIIVQATPEDIAKNKNLAALAYIIFFIPLLACPDSVFGRFHANQGLLIWIAGIVGGILRFIPLIGGILFFAVSALLVVLILLGVTSTLRGEMKPLPLIGGFQILK